MVKNNMFDTSVPFLLFIYGPMCAGKTTLAKNISKITGFKLIDSECIMKKIHPNSDYNENDRWDMYKSIFMQAQKYLNKNKNVVISCAFTNEKYLPLIKDSFLLNKIKLSLFVKVSPQIALNRWLRRKNSPKIQTAEIIYNYASKPFPILPNRVVINGNVTKKELLKTALNILGLKIKNNYEINLENTAYDLLKNANLKKEYYKKPELT